jgi:hypothetical protein
LNDNNLLPASGEDVVLGETGDVLTIRVISDIPEPATLMLLASGLVWLGLLRRQLQA